MGTLILLLILVSMVWVTIDSGDRPGLKRGEWIAGVILLWIVFFPWYLFHRKGFPKGQEIDSAQAYAGLPQAQRFLPPVSPAAPVQTLPPPGWIDDPANPGTQRWWTGEEWADHSRQTPGPSG